MRFCELREKDVVNVCDGRILGCIEDLEIDCCTGNILAVIVPVRGGLCNFFRKCEDIVIPWCHIQKIGDDVVLVELRPGGHGKIHKP
jgi:YlmC/YmxH family sporulation protein